MRNEADMSDDFYGLPVQRLDNGHVRVDVLAGAGPRIVRLIAAGSSENLLAEMPEKSWETPNGTFYIRGGHRLWHAPESFPRTYQPDNDGVTVELTPAGAQISRPAEPATGIAKRLTIALTPGRAALSVRHELRNDGAWPVELAPWAITQLRSGGTVIMPLGGPAAASALLPDRRIVLWPYTELGDPRIQLHNDYLLVEVRPGLPPAKIGIFGRAGWGAYQLGSTLLVKRYTPQPGRPHPDDGCNLECYFDQANVELETLAPLELLQPGATSVHVEEWQLYTGVPTPPDIAGVRRLAAELGLA
jgi:hypothetical protein